MTKSAVYFAFDTETGGLDAAVSDILSFSAQLLDDKLNLVDKITIYALPDREVNPISAGINGYTPEVWAAKNAVTQDAMYNQIRAFLRGHRFLTPVGHNVKFDLDFLKALFAKNTALEDFGKIFSYHSIDTIPISMIIDIAQQGSKQGSYKLPILCDRFGISLGDNAHDSESDIAATVELLRYLITTIRGNLPVPAALPVIRKLPLVQFDTGTRNWVFAYGKHKEKTYAQVLSEDPGYLDWVRDKVEDLSQEAKDALCLIRPALTNPA